jgi:hypothetical protein
MGAFSLSYFRNIITRIYFCSTTGRHVADTAARSRRYVAKVGISLKKNLSIAKNDDCVEFS